MRLFIYEWFKLRFYGLNELLQKVLAFWRNVYWVKTELDNLSRTNFNKLNYCSSQNKYPRTRNVLNQKNPKSIPCVKMVFKISQVLADLNEKLKAFYIFYF